jgi:hypothetical protein
MKQAIVGLGIFALVIAIVLLALPFVYVTGTVSEAYDIPQSSVIVSESFSVPPGAITHPTYLNAGDSLKIQMSVTSGGNRDIDFSVNDGSATYVSYSRATSVNRDWIVPAASNYNFVYDNTSVGLHLRRFLYKSLNIGQIPATWM